MPEVKRPEKLLKEEHRKEEEEEEGEDGRKAGSAAAVSLQRRCSKTDMTDSGPDKTAAL